MKVIYGEELFIMSCNWFAGSTSIRLNEMFCPYLSFLFGTIISTQYVAVREKAELIRCKRDNSREMSCKQDLSNCKISAQKHSW